MSARLNLRKELDALRAEIDVLRAGHKAQPEAAQASPPAGEQKSTATLQDQLQELNRLVETMLEEAEETVTEHPVATVAGALALGIVIGRLTAR